MAKVKGSDQELAQLKKELEQTRKENERLKELLSQASVGKSEQGEKNIGLKSALWSGISHEILTPMDAILGMTDLVMDTDLTDEQQNYLEMINASADRLFSIISDIIDYSELTEGTFRRDNVTFNFFEELEYDLYIAELTAKHKELDFSVKFGNGIPAHLNSDPSRLRQVLNNIISNAIKYTSSGGVSVKVVRDGYDGSGRMLLRFIVSDTGIGISAEAKKHIFRHPFTVDQSGEFGKYSEGGLGLVVSAKVVEMYGGEIGADNNEDSGATFWFTWPVDDPVEMYMGETPPELLEEKPDRSMVLQGASILLAEDEFINASVTKAFLENAGMHVTVVENGREAVRTTEKGAFQAILMDVQMPIMDGIEATQEIRRRERKKGGACPIIALTAHAMHGDRERCLQAGMDDYLPKPLDKDQLIEMLARYITRKALIVGSDPVGQQALIQPLVERGWGVAIAETGKMAMYEASLAHYDMIVVDSSLPVNDGLDAVKTIRQLEKFSGYRASIVGIGLSSEGYGDSGIDEFFERTDAMEAFTKKVECSR